MTELSVSATAVWSNWYYISTKTVRNDCSVNAKWVVERVRERYVFARRIVMRYKRPRIRNCLFKQITSLSVFYSSDPCVQWWDSHGFFSIHFIMCALSFMRFTCEHPDCHTKHLPKTIEHRCKLNALVMSQTYFVRYLAFQIDCAK